MTDLWRCYGCDRLVNPLVNPEFCPGCGHDRRTQIVDMDGER